MADKSEWAPAEPLPMRDALGEKVNLTVLFNRYRKYADSSKGLSCDTAEAQIPWMMNASIMRQADKADPFNQLRCYGVRIGDKLAYRLAFTELQGATEDERDRMALMAFLLLGAEHGAEIKDAIAAVRQENK